MSYEAWGDGDDGHPDCYSEESVNDAFILGARAMREMLARFVEQGGDAITAASIRANWVLSWGPDPGPIARDVALPTGPGDDRLTID